MDGEAPGSITALSVNSAYGLYIIHYFSFPSFIMLYVMFTKIELSNDSIIEKYKVFCIGDAIHRMAYGNDGGLVLIDIIQKSVLLSMASVDLYSSADPYTRLPRSPKRPTDSANSRAADIDDNSVRSPSCDQVKCVSRTTRDPQGSSSRCCTLS
jgi:syntaxin-binding protein 5